MTETPRTDRRLLLGAAALGLPLFAIGAGSDRLPTNVRVADLLVPARVYPGDRFAVQGHLQDQGLEGQVVKVELVEMPVAGANAGEGAQGAPPTGPRVLDAAEGAAVRGRLAARHERLAAALPATTR